MCNDCGCGKDPSEHKHKQENGDAQGEDHHPHSHEMPHSSSGTPAAPRRTIALNQPILDDNDRQAERNRGFFRARGLLAINVLSSPGSGKTTLLGETIKLLGDNPKAGVVVGDLATDNDALRLRAAAVQVVQINTGTVCHLEAGMVARAVKQLDLSSLGVLFIENVGNLVCPASFDLGEDLRVVLCSVTEGEDKPLKYPPMFHMADAVIVTKTDLAAACEWNRSLGLANIRKAAPKASIFELSARTGDGMARWRDYLRGRTEEFKDCGLF